MLHCRARWRGEGASAKIVGRFCRRVMAYGPAELSIYAVLLARAPGQVSARRCCSPLSLKLERHVSAIRITNVELTRLVGPYPFYRGGLRQHMNHDEKDNRVPVLRI